MAKPCISPHNYAGGRRVQKNFADKSEAKRVAKQILGELSNDAEAVEAMATPELESLVAARKALAPGYALHVAVEEHAQAVGKLGKATLREAVEFFLRHHRSDVPRLLLSEISEQFAKSREQSGLTGEYISHCIPLASIHSIGESYYLFIRNSACPRFLPTPRHAEKR